MSAGSRGGRAIHSDWVARARVSWTPSGRHLLVTATLALILTACQGGSGDPGARSPALGAAPAGFLKAEPTSATSQGAAKVTEPGPIVISGQGPESGRAVPLSDGLTIFTVTHRGRQHFLMTLRDEDGRDVAVVAAGNGPYGGSYALNLGDPCDCTLAVEADGPLAIRVEQASPTSGRPIPTRYVGQGDQATPFFQTDRALLRFRVRHQGPGTFRVDLLDATGERIDRLALAEGDFDGERTVEVDKGVYLLQVEAQGTWTIDVGAP